MRRIKLVLAALAAFLFVVLILQNTETIETKFFSATLTMPRAAILGFSMLVGFALGVVTSLYLVRRKRLDTQRKATT